MEWAREDSAIIRQLVLNSFVKFGAGLEIQHVICGFEASKVLIKNLPMDAEKPSIVEIFVQHGIDQDNIGILKMEFVDDHRQATILGKTVNIEAVVPLLDKVEFHGKKLEVSVCERSSEGHAMGASSRKSYFLSISWLLPRPHSKYTSNGVFDTLNNRLRALVGPNLSSFALVPSSKPGIAFAKAIFDSWDKAKLAHDALSSDGPKRGFPQLRLYLADPYFFITSVDEKQYNAQKSQWTELCDGQKKQVRVQTKVVNATNGGRVIITLSGSDKKIVGATKVRIENMGVGQKLDATYWHADLKSPKGLKFLDNLYDTTGAYVRCDWKHNYIAVSGGTGAIEAAKARLREEVERISVEQSVIPLNRRALGFFIREGLGQMRGILGEENVTLNVQSSEIVLRGANLEEARHHLRQLKDAFMNRNAASTATSDDVVCPICYDTVAQPVEISCEHIYCSACLRHYILSTLENHSFPLKCMGDGATCAKPLSIPLIRRFLPPQRFLQLLETAFTSYIEKNPEVFKYCNTPACSQVYRATTAPQELQCPSCFSEVCTACCDESHTGMTCAERGALKDTSVQERLLETWAIENNARKCPSCRVLVQKTEGCNHMSCKCGVHFCWICTEAFDAGSIYSHMTQAHGDWYRDPGRDQRQNTGTGTDEEIPNIFQIVGGPGAVAEQAAELRRIELRREANREAEIERRRQVQVRLVERERQQEAQRRQFDVCQEEERKGGLCIIM